LPKGKEGLKNRSRNPKRMPNKMDGRYERKITELCEKKTKKARR